MTGWLVGWVGAAMMTTFSAMRGWWRRRRSGASRLARLREAAIIGTACVLMSALLGGCNALRVAYNTGPQLTWWWLDGYVDFAGEHTPCRFGPCPVA